MKPITVSISGVGPAAAPVILTVLDPTILTSAVRLRTLGDVLKEHEAGRLVAADFLEENGFLREAGFLRDAAAAIRVAVDAEREACAKHLEEAMCGDHLPHECAAAIRARGQAAKG